MWRASEAGKAIIKANKNQLNADILAKKRKSEGGGGNSNKSSCGGDNDKAERS